MNEFPPPYPGATATMAGRLTSTMRLVYVKMTLGLLITAVIAFFCAGSMTYLQFMAQNSWAMWVLMLAELGIVFGVSAGINRLSSPVAAMLFYVFAIINGLALAPIFLIYTGASIAKTFFITAGTFGAMSVYGYFTDRDLTRIGSILFMALIGLVIASIVNIFTHSTTLDWIITFAGVIIFVGLTAWDTQQIKNMAMQMPGAQAGRLSTLGALSLYLDFLNLFLYLLRIFGSQRD